MASWHAGIMFFRRHGPRLHVELRPRVQQRCQGKRHPRRRPKFSFRSSRDRLRPRSSRSRSLWLWLAGSEISYLEHQQRTHGPRSPTAHQAPALTLCLRGRWATPADASDGLDNIVGRETQLRRGARGKQRRDMDRAGRRAAGECAGQYCGRGPGGLGQERREGGVIGICINAVLPTLEFRGVSNS